MPQPSISEMEPRQRRRVLALALLRALLSATVLVALFYFIPVDEEWRVSSAVRAVVALALFVAVLILADPEGPDVETSGRPGDRGARRDAPAFPAVVRDDVLPDVAPWIGNLPAKSICRARMRCTSPSPCSPRWGSAT